MISCYPSLPSTFYSLPPSRLRFHTLSFTHLTYALPLTENKPGPSGMGGLGIISQLLLCKTLQPDFQQEEICSIEKDSDEITAILKEMQEYMPQVRKVGTEGGGGGT